MTIPKNINREHIIEAIQKIDREGVPERRESTRFKLKGEHYPPKFVISLANIFANGEDLLLCLVVEMKLTDSLVDLVLRLLKVILILMKYQMKVLYLVFQSLNQ